MNRLWVRLSLVFAVVVIVSTMAIALTVRLTNAVLTNPQTPPPAEVVAHPDEARSRPPLTRLTTVMVIIGVVAIGAGTWMSRSLTAPLEELETAAQAVGRRDFDRRVPVQGSRELVAVATAFNEMSTQLGKAETLRRNLLADVAHELRHPVHVLQGTIQAFLDDVYPLNKEELTRLYEQTRHLAALVNDLHVLAQAEANQLPLHRQRVDIGVFVKDIATAFMPLASAKGVSLRVELLGTMPELGVDTIRLRQAIHNLIDNALRHTAEDGEITISVERIQGETQVRIRDAGVGIAPERLPHIFDRFYRAESARGRDRDGVGLGLAIAMAIVEAHGGDIAATSQVGVGSTFTISLPSPVPE